MLTQGAFPAGGMTGGGGLSSMALAVDLPRDHGQQPDFRLGLFVSGFSARRIAVSNTVFMPS